MVNAHLGLTYACNMSCKHCYVKEKKHNEVLVNQDVLLEKLEQFGTFYITYTMGETLLWKEFAEFAEKAKSKGFYQILLSNGSTIQSDDMVNNLVDMGIKKVGISIDSSDENIHDSNRNYSGAYKLACNAISLLSKQSNIWTQVTVTIGNHNLDDVIRIIENMVKLGVKSFSFLWMRGSNGIEPIENKKKYEKVMRTLILKKNNDGLDINVHDYRMNPLIDKMYESGEISLDTKEDFLNMNTCHALSELVLIDPSGDMYACNFSKKPFANVYSTPLEKIAMFSCKDKPLCKICNRKY